MSERELETVPADPSDSELLAMFANTICPALSEFLVDYGASAAHWDDAARQLREIAAKLAAAEARAVRCEGERELAQDALERIHSETNSANREGCDPGMLCFSIHVTARDALQALGVL
jgi:hypothetical protein